MDWLTNAFQGIGNAVGGAANSIGSGISGLFGGGNKSSGGGMFGNLLGSNSGSSSYNPGMMGAGLGMAGLGQLFGGTPKMPDFNTPQVQAMQNYQFGNRGNLTPEATQAIEYSLAPQEEIQRRNLNNTYANMLPGSNQANSSLGRDTNYLEQTISNNRNAAYQGAINNIDQEKYQQLSDGANWSVASLAQKYNMDAQSAMQMKSMMGGIGGMFMQKGLYPQGMGMNMMGNQGNQTAASATNRNNISSYDQQPFTGWF